MFPSGRCYPDLSSPPPWASQGSPTELEPVFIQQASPLPGVRVLSCLPRPPKAKQAAQKQSWLWTQQGHHTGLMGQDSPQRRDMQESDGFVTGTSLEDALPCFCLCTLTCGSKPGYYRMGVEHRMACGAGSQTSPTPGTFSTPLSRSAGGHVWGPQHRGELAPRVLDDGAEQQILCLKEL